MATDKTKRQHESGHSKIIESLGKLIAQSETLDQTRLNPPPDLALPSLQNLRVAATALHTAVGDAKAVWQTSALARTAVVGQFEALAAQAVGQLEARGASAATIEDARGYVRKLQGRRAEPKLEDDPTTLGINESEQNISASQQSNAALIATFNQLVDFLEQQPAYAGVTKPELLVSNLRALALDAQAKHDDSITAAAALSSARIARNRSFYLDEGSICALAARFKQLVKGEYGASSPEYKAVNAIPFKKPRI